MHKVFFMNKEKISIIVPVYNSQSTISKCINSLLRQTYENIEIILVDDGSCDHSLDICLFFKNFDKRIKVFNKQNGGVSSARNFGIEMATGKFIMFCDSDDWVENTWCETMINLYIPECLVMSGYYCHYQDKNQWIGEYIEDKVIPKEDYLLTKKYGGFAPWNKLFCLDKIKLNQIRFPDDITLGEDQLFVWRYLQCISGDIIYSKKPLNHYSWPEKQSLTLNLPFDYYRQCERIFLEISADIDDGFVCSNDAKMSFYRDMYFQYERALRRIFQDTKLNEIRKILLSTKVMRNIGYQTVFKLYPGNNKIKRFLCNYNGLGIYLLYKLGRY